MINPNDPEEEKLRENLICKIKKICDDFELSDDTFFRTVFLYDLQRRVKPHDFEKNCILENKTLAELFKFGEGEAGEKKWVQYEKFFEILSCLAIAIKYYEHERVSPGVIHILKYFRMEKLNVEIKSDLEELKEIEDLQEIILEIIYEYICEKQTEIIFKIHWKLQIVNVKHFIDHYVKILPDFKKLQMTNLKQHFGINNKGKEGMSNLLGPKALSKKMISLQELLNEEIEDCIDSVSKLAPLVPHYIDYSWDEIGSASLLMAIRHSIKSLVQEANWDKADMELLKGLYSKWTNSVFKKYRVNRSKIADFWDYLQEFLSKVCE